MIMGCLGFIFGTASLFALSVLYVISNGMLTICEIGGADVKNY